MTLRMCSAVGYLNPSWTPKVCGPLKSVECRMCNGHKALEVTPKVIVIHTSGVQVKGCLADVRAFQSPRSPTKDLRCVYLQLSQPSLV